MRYCVVEGWPASLLENATAVWTLLVFYIIAFLAHVKYWGSAEACPLSLNGKNLSVLAQMLLFVLAVKLIPFPDVGELIFI